MEERGHCVSLEMSFKNTGT